MDLPTKENAKQWLRKAWETGVVVNTFQKLSEEIRKELADARAEIAGGIADDGIKWEFYKFCSRCAISDHPDWEASRKKKDGL